MAAGVIYKKADVLIFRDIFKFFPKTVVAKDMGKRVNRFNEFMNRPEELKIGEVKEIADLFGVHWEIVMGCITRQLRRDPEWRDAREGLPESTEPYAFYKSPAR